MSLARARKMNPAPASPPMCWRSSAFSDVCEKVEIAGAGFLNFRLNKSVLTQTLEAAARGEHLFFDLAAQPKTAVIDFSSPNVAKPMHVGHIRSTGIGDALQRTLRLLGHRVIFRQPTSATGARSSEIYIFTYGLENQIVMDRAALRTATPLPNLNGLYQIINAESDAKPGAARGSQSRTGKHSRAGDPENNSIWKGNDPPVSNPVRHDYSRLGVKI